MYVLEEEGDILFSSFCQPLLTPRSKCTQPSSGRGENSPSNEQWTKCLHPGKRWCRNTGSSENRGCSVSIYWAFTVHVPFSTWPGLLSLSTAATTLEVCLQKSVLSHSCEGSEKCLLADIIHQKRHRFMWNKPPQLSHGIHLSMTKTLFWQCANSCETMCSSIWQHTSESGAHCGGLRENNMKAVERAEWSL